MKFHRLASFSLVLCASFCGLAAARGRLIMNQQQPGAGGIVNLPYQVQDNQGTTWMLYGSGWLQQQGNMPVYSQAAILSINQNQPTMNVNQARLDPKSGEVIFENMPCMNTTVPAASSSTKTPESPATSTSSRTPRPPSRPFS